MADKMCDQGWFGQKTKKGWYLYDPSAPRKPLENIDTLNLIENHRRDSVSSIFYFIHLTIEITKLINK